MERIVDIPSDIETIKVGLNDPLFTKMLTGFPVREEIIRCRDRDHLIECMDLDDWCSRHESEVNPDGFCAWAERREDG